MCADLLDIRVSSGFIATSVLRCIRCGNKIKNGMTFLLVCMVDFAPAVIVGLRKAVPFVYGCVGGR